MKRQVRDASSKIEIHRTINGSGHKDQTHFGYDTSEMYIKEKLETAGFVMGMEVHHLLPDKHRKQLLLSHLHKRFVFLPLL